ncbi:MAG: LysM domain-containing protein [Pseudomonadales bacterium]|jgi:hypothetical protein|nr:LysM domain-containing protein [Pseudomonadales bacterium]
MSKSVRGPAPAGVLRGPGIGRDHRIDGAHRRRLRFSRSAGLLGLLFVLAVAIVPMVPAVDAAQGTTLVRSDQPGIYVVKKGDTLWDISGMFLTQPWRWPEIWRVNPEIENPHLIYPGDTIRLRYVDGQPALVLERGEGGRTTRLTPSDTVTLEPSVRATPLLTAIPAVDLDAIGPFLSSNRIVEPDALDGAPYVLQGDDGRILVGAGDRFYARGLDGYAVGDGLAVVRRGGIYIDPDSGEPLGLEAEEIGTARIMTVTDDVGTLAVSTSRSDIRIADRLLPIEERAISSFFPSAPAEDVQGRMIAVLDGVNQIGQFSVVAINLGERDGIERGNVLAVLRQGPLVRDRVARDVIRMPSDRAGLMMVFRVFEKLSYGIVLQSDRPLSVLDEVTNP